MAKAPKSVLPAVRKIAPEQASPWSRAPWWRWATALECVAYPAKSIAPLEADPFLFDTVMYLKACRALGTSPVIAKRYPTLEQAAQLWRSSQVWGYRWFVEAALVSEASDADIAARLPFNCTEKVVQLFRKIFFDVQEWRDNPVYLAASVMGPCEHSLTSGVHSEYLWKRMAATWGFGLFYQAFCNVHANGKEGLPPKIRDWLKQLQGDSMVIHTLTCGRRLHSSYGQQALDILRLADQHYVLDDDAIKKGEDLLGTGGVRELLDNVRLQLIDSEEKFPADEQFPIPIMLPEAVDK